LLSFLLAAGEREARQLKSHDSEQYVSVKTSELRKKKAEEASMEKFRRAVWTIMQWNETHSLLERWYLATLAIQELVGGDKKLINAYLDAHAEEEIEAHHQQWEIKPSANRKHQSIQEMILVPEEPIAFPWGRAVEEEEDRSGGIPTHEQGCHQGLSFPQFEGSPAYCVVRDGV
jgi:hypothetical protein